VSNNPYVVPNPNIPSFKELLAAPDRGGGQVALAEAATTVRPSDEVVDRVRGVIYEHRWTLLQLRTRLARDYPEWDAGQITWTVAAESSRILAEIKAQGDWEPEHEDLMDEVAVQRIANPHLGLVDLVDAARLVLQARYATWNSYGDRATTPWVPCDHDYVNVGFSSIQMVCKKCDREQ
jgi:hypothetical protein